MNINTDSSMIPLLTCLCSCDSPPFYYSAQADIRDAMNWISIFPKLFCAAFALGISADASAQDNKSNDNGVEDVVASIRRSWKEYPESKFANYDTKVSIREVDLADNEKITFDEVHHFRRSNDFYVASFKPKQDRIPAFPGMPRRLDSGAFGANSKYHFTLSLNKKGEWVLGDVDLKTSLPKADSKLSSFIKDNPVWMHLNLMNEPLDESFSKKKITAKSVIVKDEVAVVDLKGYNGVVLNGESSGLLKIDIKSGCLLETSGVYSLNGVKNISSTTFDYLTVRNGPPRLMKVVEKIKSITGDKTAFDRRKESSFSYSDEQEAPESSFSLTFFGMPEPNGVVWPKPTPWYLWFSAAGLVCLAFMVWFRRKSKLRNAASSVKS